MVGMNVSQQLASIDRRLELMTDVLVDGVRSLQEMRETSDRHTAVLEEHTQTLRTQTATLESQTATLESQTATLTAQTATLQQQSAKLTEGNERSDALTQAILRALDRLDRD